MLTGCSSVLANEKSEMNAEDYIIVTADGSRSAGIASAIYSGKTPDFNVPYKLEVSLSENALYLNNLNLNFDGLVINFNVSVLPEITSMDLNTLDFSLISLGRSNDEYMGTFLVELKFGYRVRQCDLRDQYSAKLMDSRPYMALYLGLDGRLDWQKYELNEECHYVLTASEFLIED